MNKTTYPGGCADTYPSQGMIVEKIGDSNAYVVRIPVPKDVFDRVDRFLTLPSGLDENEYQGDSTIFYTAQFPNGVQADVKCCGCRDEASWAEMVLFDKKGCELCCTEPAEEFGGEWSLDYGNITYVVIVEAV